VPVVFSAWRDDPVGGLVQAIREAIAPFADGPLDLPASARLDEIVSAAAHSIRARLLIVLDQFEEYFLYHPLDGGEGSFAEDFPRAVNRTGLPAGFLVSIREDALAQLDRFKGDIPKLFDTYLRVSHLDVEAAREAILRPVEHYNDGVGDGGRRVVIEPALVDAVLEQVRTGQVVLERVGRGAREGGDGVAESGRDQVETPYLQLVMTRLWNEELAAGSRELRLATLTRLGGAQEIVRTHLDTALADLGDQREAVADIFHHLVTPSGTKIAHTARDLAEYSHHPEGEVDALLARLSSGDTWILRPVPPPRGDDGPPRYEIFHDVLAPAILDWRNRQTAVRLEREKREAEGRASKEHRRARALAALSVGLLVALLLGAWAAVTAERHKHEAQSRELAASAQANIASDPELSVLLGLAALHKRYTAQAEAALRAALPQVQDLTTLHEGSSLLDAAFSPDGARVATASQDGRLTIWDTASGRGTTLRVCKCLVRAVAFGRRGTIATGSDDGVVRVWRAGAPPGTTPRPTRLCRPQYCIVYDVAFDPSGTALAAAASDGRVTLLRTSPGHGPQRLHICDEFCGVLGVAYSHDGSRLAIAGEGGIADVWSLATRRRIRSLAYNTVPVATAVFSPHDRRVLTASYDGTARLWDAASGRRLAAFAITGSLLGASFSPDGRAILTASDTGRVSVWDLGSHHVLTDLAARAGTANAAAFSPRGTKVVTASEDGNARIWQASPRELRRVHAVDSAFVRVAGFTPNGDVVTGGEDGAVRLWNLRTGKQHRVLDLSPGGVTDVAVTSDGRVWAVDSARVAYRWDAKTGRRGVVGKLVVNVASSRDGKLLGVADIYGDVRVSNRTTGKRVTLETKNAVNDVAFSPSGTRVMTAGGDGNLRMWRTDRRGRPLTMRVTTNAYPVTVAFSPDGKMIVTTASDGSVAVWSLAGRGKKPVATFNAGNATATSASFSPDGRTIMGSTEDGTAHIWDLDSGKELTSFTVASGINTASFNAGGTAVLTAGNDGKLRLWSTELAAPLPTIERIARHRLTRGLTPAERATYLAGIGG